MATAFLLVALLSTFNMNSPRRQPSSATRDRMASQRQLRRAARAALSRAFYPELLERRVLMDSTVVFSEVMYHPAGTNEEPLEWVELQNEQAVDMDLSGWSLAGGISYTFPAGTRIAGGAYMVIASDPAALQAATGYAGAKGPFSGHLANDGETLQLVNNSAREMDSVSYEDGFGTDPTSGDWPVAADGGGVTLAKIDVDGGSAPARSWAASAQINGTPGAPNFPSGLPTPMAVFNEAAAGSTGSGFFVELANPTASTQSIGGYVVKRYGATNDEYVLPAGTSIAAGGVLPITAATLGYSPAIGDKVMLYNPAKTAVLDAIGIDSVVRGRATTGTGQWLYPSAATPGAANTVSLNSSVVINEVMYSGRTAPSVPVSFNFDTAWKYNQAGAEPAAVGGQTWKDTGFVDTGWSSGTGVLYAGSVPGSTNPTTQPITSLFSSGKAANGQQLGVGQADPHFKLAFSANGDPAGTLATVTQPNGAWQASDSNSQWISVNSDGFSPIAAGAYGFETTFDLAGFSPSTAFISGNLWADNRVTDVLINGQSTGVSMEGFSAPTAFSISTGFVPGINTLRFVMVNDTDNPNPGAFRVQMGGTAKPIPLNTQLSLGPTTYYFRKSFDFNGDPASASILLSPYVDDGAVFYLNGQPLYRQNMPASGVTYSTLASTLVDSPSMSGPISVPAGALRRGTNVLAVEVHQGSSNSTDVAFGAELQVNPLPAVRPEGEEWLELYNRTGSSVDLSGWKVADAVDYTFPAGSSIGAGQYVVLAKDPALVQSMHPGLSIAGTYSGGLAGSNDRIRLLDGRGNPADDVHYYDSGRWSGYADGGGSSLELKDPDADNAKPEAWAASNEGLKTGWRTYTYRGVAADGAGDPQQWNEFVMGLLDAGEVLVDDVSVIENPGTASAVQFIQNGSFEGATGISKFRVIGDHHGSLITDPTNPANHVMRLVATAPTEHMHNHAETTFANSHSVTNGTTYEISFRAKWIAGNNLLNTRLWFNRLAETNVLDTPLGGGTPGAANSTAQTNIGPTFDDFRHGPFVPAPNQVVAVSAQAQDPDGVASMKLFYSVNGGAWNNLGMTALGGGKYAGNIPGQANGTTVQFYAEATDGLGAVSDFPAKGPNSRALYKVDSTALNGNLHDLRIIQTPGDIAYQYATINVMSDDPLGATVIYDDRLVYYDVNVRLKSSERGRVEDGRIGFNVQFSPDQPFRGVHDSISIDRSGGYSQGSKQDEIVAKQIIQEAGGIPGMYDDLVNVIAPRSANNGTALLGMARYGNEFLDTQFANGGDGTVFKFELIYYPTQTDNGNPEGNKIPQPDDVRGVEMQSLGADKDQYRWHYLIENNTDEDDYTGAMNTAKLFDLSGAALDQRSKEVLDVDEWLRLIAVHQLIGDGDSYGIGYQHNFDLYTRPSDGKVLAMPWDWDFAWGIATNSSLMTGSNLQKLASLPGNLHAYYGHIKNLLDTSYNPTYTAYWTNLYGNLLGQNFSGVQNYITSRYNYARSALPAQVPFQITTHGGTDFSTDQSSVTITGDGWIDARDIYLAGHPDPLNVTWTDVDSWTATIPLAPGANGLTFQAKGFDGVQFATDSITVTNTSTAPRVADNLRLTELMYHPSDPPSGAGYTDKDLEYVELQNVGTQPLDIGGSKLTTAIDYQFAAGYTLQPGQYVLIVSNRSAFESRYGTSLNVAGQYERNLSNSSDTVALLDPTGQSILSFTYLDSWIPTTDGSGPSLVKLNPSALDTTSYGLSTGWRASTSTVPGGSPGVADPDPNASAPTATVVNVTPNPRQAAVASVAINFSEPVTNFDSADLRLTRNGTIVPLGTVTLTSSEGTNYTLSGAGLISATTPAGTYLLTVVAAGSGIQDTTHTTFATDASASWQTFAVVTGRRLFYNNSKFDGAGTNGNDDAVATDKQAMLPSTTQSVAATFANYSSYASGINGIMIDVSGLPVGTTLTAADFEFRSGNTLAAGADPGTAWGVFGNAPTITRRPGAGVGGADRFELIWLDNQSVKNAWLRVAVKANANTGLAAADVFYFGSAVADTGNSATNAVVDSNDYYGVRDHLRSYDNPAPITYSWDFNRDGIVDITDVMLARSSSNTPSTALQLISLSPQPLQSPATKPTPTPSPVVSPTPTPMPTPVPSPSPTPTPSPSPTPVPTPTPSPTPTTSVSRLPRTLFVRASRFGVVQTATGAVRPTSSVTSASTPLVRHW